MKIEKGKETCFDILPCTSNLQKLFCSFQEQKMKERNRNNKQDKKPMQKVKKPVQQKELEQIYDSEEEDKMYQELNSSDFL